MAGRAFEDWQVGDRIAHEIRRTVTETDNLLFSCMTHNPQPLHIDAEAAKASEFGQIIVNGTFTFALMIGLSVGETTLGTLIAARVFQGLGGAMMVPVGRLVLLRTVSKSEMVDSLAYLTVPGLIGPVVGPPFGGFFTTSLPWRWIFWINLPLGGIAFLVIGRQLRNLEIARIKQKIDWLGGGSGTSLPISNLKLIAGDRALRADLAGLFAALEGPREVAGDHRPDHARRDLRPVAVRLRSSDGFNRVSA